MRNVTKDRNARTAIPNSAAPTNKAGAYRPCRMDKMRSSVAFLLKWLASGIALLFFSAS